MNGTWYHAEIHYSDGEIQDEFFATKSTRQDYVDYIKKLGHDVKLYTSKRIGPRNKNAIANFDRHIKEQNNKLELPWC